MSDNHHDDDKTQTHLPLLKDTTVGHYRIVEKIGAGGMGEVYLAQDTELDRKVALKFLPSHLCQDEDCRARFKREAQAAAKLSHPNIITVFEVSEYKGRPFFAMEHVEGRSLKEYSSGKDLSIEQILELAIQICDGLHAAHEKGVTHRDIKPSNILIDSHGRARIVDFGLASVVGKDQLTKTGSTLGTIGYMSPEQVRGQEIDRRTDLFSLGVVLYELMTNQNPFKRDSEASTLKAVSDDLPEPMARFKSGLPEGLQAIIDKALEKDLKTRYQHADGMQSDLMRVKRSMESGQVAADGRVTAKRSSRVWWFAATLIVVAVAVGLIVMKPWQINTSSNKPDKIMLAVLPFENLGDPEDEYFADGVTEEITSRLASVHNLGIISRTSAYTYKNSEKTLPQIALELGVDYILEGTLRWDKTADPNRVLVTPQLIDVINDTHMWSDRYERLLTDIFAVQKDIAVNVVEALNVRLVGREETLLTKEPSTDIEAYELFLKGLEYQYTSNAYEARRFLEKAVELAPEYAEAHAALSYVYSMLASLDSSMAVKALRAAERSLEIDPDLGEGYLALGIHYYGRAEFEKAASEFVVALEHIPSNPDALAYLGLARRRHGLWKEAHYLLKRAIGVDPLNNLVWENYSSSCILIKQYDDLLEVASDLVRRFPNQPKFHICVAHAIKKKYGASDGLRREVKVISSLIKPDSLDLGGLSRLSDLADLEIFIRDFPAALRHLEVLRALVIEELRPYYFLAMGFLNRYNNHPEESRIYFDSARVGLEAGVARASELSGVHARLQLALIYAALADREKALSMLDTISHYSKSTGDAFLTALISNQASYIYALLGDYDRAISQLETSMDQSGLTSVPEMRSDPFWDPLRDHPRFQALIEKYDIAN